jgi:hypothetical protein
MAYSYICIHIHINIDIYLFNHLKQQIKKKKDSKQIIQNKIEKC